VIGVDLDLDVVVAVENAILLMDVVGTKADAVDAIASRQINENFAILNE